MMSKKKVLLLSVLLLFCGIIHAQLPSVSLKTLDGKTVCVDTLSNNGRPMVISFFAIWCKPCKRELSAIHDIYPDWQAETGVKIIAVSIDQVQNVQKVKPLMDENGWEYDVLLDSNSELKRYLGVNTIPYVFLLDGNGRIVYQHNGYAEGDENVLYDKIKELCK